MNDITVGIQDVSDEIRDFVHLLATKQIRVTHIEIQESPTTKPFTAMRAPALAPPEPVQIANPLGDHVEFANVLIPDVVAAIKSVGRGYQTFQFDENSMGWVSYKDGKWNICISPPSGVD